MTTKQFWTSTSLSVVLCLAIVGAIVKTRISPSPAPPTPIPSPDPVPAPPTPDVQAVTIAQQKAKLKLSDGRAATFRFAASGGSLQCSAAVGLDEVLCYDLVPAGDPLAPTSPLPRPKPPTPHPQPPAPTPAPTPSNLRLLFLYDPLTLIDMPPGQQAILASPELRSYLDKHCPLESGCAAGACPVKAGRTPSYRFLPINADVSRLSPVWQQTCKAAAAKPAPWMIAVNEAGQTLLDQSWPATPDETLKLLKKFGGE